MQQRVHPETMSVQPCLLEDTVPQGGCGHHYRGAGAGPALASACAPPRWREFPTRLCYVGEWLRRVSGTEKRHLLCSACPAQRRWRAIARVDDRICEGPESARARAGNLRELPVWRDGILCLKQKRVARASGGHSSVVCTCAARTSNSWHRLAERSAAASLAWFHDGRR